MAPSSKKPPARLSIEPLTPAAFSSFGNVVANPSHSSSSDWPSVPSSTTANQGSATKYSDVSHITNHYGLSPSRKPAQPLMSMFVCSPRPLTSALDPITTTLPYPGTTKTLSVPVLERHPYTTQTFIPLGLSPSDRETAYIVIVAPTLPSSSPTDPRPPPYPVPERSSSPRPSLLRRVFSRARPEPFTNSWSPSTSSSKEYRARATPLTETLFKPRGPGAPDLSRAKAFVAHGGQAVTYAPGTWHAPMIVVGAKEVEFVVVQWGNGVAEEDCQEVDVEKIEGEGLEVVVEEGAFGLRTGAGVGVRAKL
ncbi:ureidoglycolate hydrolase [Myriangium duriaei CBS 260.36]|uniref:Ureidoglycolate hydrolase n=1 Tax=Myriangium duriaei CBS 260.36 TaxID=1168546 RepID=A0A9P4MCK9_9PEZI|nr:ureidoglycolate hydrolase [Myriangium duriaei CBS 260.36]